MKDEVAEAINHFSVLMEQQNAKLDAMLEAAGSIQATVNDLPTRAEFNALRQDVQTIKLAVQATNHDVADLDHRVTRLEAAGM